MTQRQYSTSPPAGVNLSWRSVVGTPITLGSTVTGPQTLFQLMPELTPGGVAEYTVTIGSQSLRYRNEPPQWSNFAWGGSTTVPSGAKRPSR